MSDVVTKVQALIEHAIVEPTTNEARNAAVKACRLIRLHKLHLIEVGSQGRSERSGGGGQPQADRGERDPALRTARIVGEVLGGMAHEYGRARRRR